MAEGFSVVAVIACDALDSDSGGGVYRLQFRQRYLYVLYQAAAEYMSEQRNRARGQSAEMVEFSGSKRPVNDELLTTNCDGCIDYV